MRNFFSEELIMLYTKISYDEFDEIGQSRIFIYDNIHLFLHTLAH